MHDDIDDVTKIEFFITMLLMAIEGLRLWQRKQSLKISILYEGRFLITWILPIVPIPDIQSDSSRLQITALLPLFQILYDSPICHKK